MEEPRVDALVEIKKGFINPQNCLLACQVQDSDRTVRLMEYLGSLSSWGFLQADKDGQLVNLTVDHKRKTPLFEIVEPFKGHESSERETKKARTENKGLSDLVLVQLSSSRSTEADLSLMLSQFYDNLFLYRTVSRFMLLSKDSFVPKPIEWITSGMGPLWKWAIENEAVIRIHTYPSKMAAEVSRMIPQDVRLHPSSFTHVLSIVRRKHGFWWGIYDFKKWNSTLLKKKTDLKPRSFYKIREVVERMRPEIVPCSTWNVLDVGAAPGGWSMFLSPNVQAVVAVDSGDLKALELPPENTLDHSDNLPKQLQETFSAVVRSPRDKVYANVIHLKTTIQKASEALLSVARKAELLFHFVVVDINRFSHEITGIVEPLIPIVRPGGWLLVTLKMPRRAKHNIARRVATAKENFLKSFKDFDVVDVAYLLSNQHERTLLARKKTK